MYSIDEVFIDATNYLPLYGLNGPGALPASLSLLVLQETGITATAGVGPNLYLMQGGHGCRGQAYQNRIKTASGSRSWTSGATGETAVVPPTPDGFLAGGQGLRAESWRPTACTPWGMSPGCSLEPDEDLLYRLFRCECGAAHRPRLGVGAGALMADIKALSPGEKFHGLRVRCSPARIRRIRPVW